MVECPEDSARASTNYETTKRDDFKINELLSVSPDLRDLLTSHAWTEDDEELIRRLCVLDVLVMACQG